MGSKVETEGSEWFTSLRNPHDYVILQDQSQVPGFPTSSSYWQDSMEGARIIDDLVDDNGGDTFFLMTWGYRNGDESNSWRYPDYGIMQQYLENLVILLMLKTYPLTEDLSLLPQLVWHLRIYFCPFLMLLKMELFSQTYTLLMAVILQYKGRI